MKNNTSWGAEAEWYDSLIKSESNYQKDLILPNLLRLVEVQKRETILDLACGQGFFTSALVAKGAKTIGVDISKELITIAKKNEPKANFFVGSADDVKFIKSESVDKIISVLAIQNIENVAGTFKEAARVLKGPARTAGAGGGGKMYLVLNHPAFRIPKESDWQMEDKQETINNEQKRTANNKEEGQREIQWRRVARYLSELKNKIQMHPSTNSGQVPLRKSEYTLSFHRPLQYYFKALRKAGFLVSGLEEWSGHKKSVGKHAEAENRARVEIPLFLYLEVVKN